MSGSPFFNPTISALLSAGGALGQAAMPSRMPISLGAALGMAGPAFEQGAQAGVAGQMREQQVQQAQLANEQMRMFLPLYQYSIGQVYPGLGGGQGQGAAPGASPSAPAAPGGAPVSAPFGAPSQDAYGGAIMSPQSALALATMSTFNPTGGRAVGPWLGMARSAMPNGGGTMLTPNGVVPTPGALPAEQAAAAAKAAGAAGGALPYVGPTAAAKANAQVPAKIAVKMNTPGPLPGGGYGTPASILNGNGTNGAESGGAPQAGAIPAQDWAMRVQQFENNTGNPAAANASGPNGAPTSSAMGNAQFTAGTFVPLFRQTFPQVAADMSDAQVAAMRALPGVSSAMAVKYAQINAPTLARAGVPVNAMSLGMAHLLGPTDAVNVLQAPSNAPLSSVLPQQDIAANPKLFGAYPTAGALRARMFMAYGNAPVAGIAAAPNSAPASEPAPGVTVRGGNGAPVYTTNMLPLQQKQAQTDLEEVGKDFDEASQLQQTQLRLFEQKNLIDQLPQAGAGGEFRAAVSNYATTYLAPILGKPVSAFIAKIGDLPPADIAQQLAKLRLQAAGLQEREAVGARGGARLTELYQKANPSIDLQPDANRQISHLQIMSTQMDLDYLRGQQSFVTNNYTQFAAGKTKNYVPAAQFDKQWIQQRNPQIYLAATEAWNGLPFNQWAAGMAKQEGLQALQTLARVDPTATVMGDDGKPWPVSRFLPAQTASAAPPAQGAP